MAFVWRCTEHGVSSQVEPCCLSAVESGSGVGLEAASVLFEELAGETYFGINMRLVMSDMSDAEFLMLWKIVLRCKRMRGANVKESILKGR